MNVCQSRISSAVAEACGRCCAPADFVLPPSGCAEEVPDGAQEQRGEFGEVSGGAEETAPEEPGQQAPLQIRRQGDAGQCVCVCV